MVVKNINKKNKNKNKNKRFKWKVFFGFLVFEFVFTAATGPFLMYYGPFKNVQRTVVGAAMTTLSHQYIATAFLSKERIDEILSENKVEDIDQDVVTPVISIPKMHDDTIERFNFESKRYKGILLVIHDPTRVKVGYSSKLGTEGQTTSQIANNFNAVAAINGGAFTDESANSKWTGNGGKPAGIIMSEGKIVYNDLDKKKKYDIIAMTKEGKMLVGKHSFQELQELSVTDALSFGPALVVNGQPTIKTGDGGAGIAPRTAIGQRRDGSILLLVIDGRSLESPGATYKEVQDIMIQYEAINAQNLDGGKSTTMYYEGEVINNPSESLGERSIPSAIVVK